MTLALEEQCVYVAWRRPGDGLIVPVGVLTHRRGDDGPRYRFAYLKQAERHRDFVPLPGLPDLHQVYERATLFPVFANRLMPSRRPDYPDFVEQLDLALDSDPFEVLARSEGIRATDRIEVFPGPSRTSAGDLTTVFFARGIRHVVDAESVVEQLSVGDELAVERQPENRVNPRALLLNTTTGRRIGWMPDYLLDLYDDLEEMNGDRPTVVVEHINPIHTPAHLRMLCRLTAAWPSGYQPFNGPNFQPLHS